MKKMCTILLLSMVSMLQGMDLDQTVSSNIQQAETVYVDGTSAIESFVETLKSCALIKDWSTAFAQLEIIKKEPRLVLQLNKAYWDVNPLVRTTVLSYALLLNAPQELIKSLINCGAPVTNLSPKEVPPLLIMAMKTTGAVLIDPREILGEKVVSAILNEVVDRAHVKDLITLLCASGASIQDAFFNSIQSDPTLQNISPLDWAIIAHDKDLLEHFFSQQKDIQQRKDLLLNRCVLAARTFVIDKMIPFMTTIQRLAGEECFKLLLKHSQNNISELFDACSHLIAGFQGAPCIPADQAAELAESSMKLLSLFIDHGVDINHLIKKRTILDRAQDEGWHKALIDFLIQKGARNGSYEFTQEEMKTKAFRKKFHDMMMKRLSGLPFEQEKIRELLKDALELVKNPGIMSFTPEDASLTCNLALILGTLLEESLEFLIWSESRNLFSGNSHSYGNISSVFHKIVSWLHDVKCTASGKVFNGLIKPEFLRSLLVKLAKMGVKDTPNSEGKTAAQKAYELGFEEIAHLITNSVSKD